MRITALALLLLATPHTAEAKQSQKVARVATRCPGHVQGVYFYRGQTRKYERMLGRRPSRSVFNASTTSSCKYTVWVAHHWQHKLVNVRSDYNDYLAWKRRHSLEIQRSLSSSTSSSSYGSAFCGAACVQCESGGNPNAVSPDGTYWGLWQFDRGTWVAHGGNPATYGSAGAAEQAAVASRVRYQAWPTCGGR